MLLEERLITEGVLRAARRQAKRERLPIVVILLEEEHLTEQQLVDLLARRLKLPVVEPARLQIDEDVLREIPYDLAEKYRVMPLALVPDARPGVPARLRLAMADPLDRDALDELGGVTGRPIDPVIAPAIGLSAAIRHRYRGAITRLLPHAEVRPHAESSEATEPESARTPRPVRPRRPDDMVTQPLLRVDEETTLDIRLKALTVLLVEAGVISERAYAEMIRKLTKDRDTGE